MQEKSKQFKLMKEGKSFSFDKYLFDMQKKCFNNLLEINRLPFDSKNRENILKKLFAKYGDNNILKNNFNCNFGFNISIGSSCYINYNVTILDSYEVEIGNRVFIAPGVVISAVTHPLEFKDRKKLIIKKVVIEDDVWIGANTVILPGVKIGKGAVIGACSLVKTNVPANTVFAGVPARKIKSINN